MRGTKLPLLICLLLAYCASGQTCPDGVNCRNCGVDFCLACQVDPANCESCLKKYYLDSNQCLDCPAGCLACNLQTECTECTPGYQSQFNDAGQNICVFYWWKWLLIIFGTIAGIALIGILIWYIRGKLKGDSSQSAEPSRSKYEMTEAALK